jgi:hypothetical protein
MEEGDEVHAKLGLALCRHGRFVAPDDEDRSAASPVRNLICIKWQSIALAQ